MTAKGAKMLASISAVPVRNRVGRPRKEGPRYKNGVLKRGHGRAAARPDQVVEALSLAQREALDRYSRHIERSETGSAVSRLSAQDALRSAKAALGPLHTALVEAAARGLTVAAMAAKAGRREAELAIMMNEAASKLARHYEGGE